MTRLGVPVVYDEFGRPIGPRWATEDNAVAIQELAPIEQDAPGPELDYLGYKPSITETFVSCICRSEHFFHVRWKFFDEEPSEDDGTTLCDRRRTRDKEGFWNTELTHCAECEKGIRQFAEDFADDEYVDWV